MASALDSRLSSLGSNPDWGTVFLGKSIYFHRASLHPGQMGTSKLNGGNTAHPIQEGVKILLIA